MGPGLFVLAVLGCGDSAAMCQQIARKDTVYRSEAACLAGSEEVLVRESSRPYPLLMAECRPYSAQSASFWGNSEG